MKSQKKKTASKESAPPDSPGASFSLSQIISDMSQANVVFQKSFNGKSLKKIKMELF